MMPSCPQCRQPIDGIATKTYHVGWCQRDVHSACLPLHARSCAPCASGHALLSAAQGEK